MSLESNMNLQDYIIDVPDWPKEGIVFKDIKSCHTIDERINR